MLTYSTFVPSIANLLVVPTSDPGFNLALPNIIDDAEQRLYRELDLLSTIVKDSSGALTAGSRNFTLPTTGGNSFVVVENINIITPVGTTNPDLGTRNPCTPASKELLDALYPNVTGSSVPSRFAMITQTTIIFGPWPNAAYQVEVVGTQRPAPMSASNQTTFLSANLPDCLLAAGMVFGCAYQKNFSEMGDQPQSAVSWETHLKSLLASANIEEMRKKFVAEGWSSKQPDPLATPPRT